MGVWQGCLAAQITSTFHSLLTCIESIVHVCGMMCCQLYTFSLVLCASEVRYWPYDLKVWVPHSSSMSLVRFIDGVLHNVEGVRFLQQVTNYKRCRQPPLRIPDWVHKLEFPALNDILERGLWAMERHSQVSVERVSRHHRMFSLRTWCDFHSIVITASMTLATLDA